MSCGPSPFEDHPYNVLCIIGICICFQIIGYVDSNLITIINDGHYDDYDDGDYDQDRHGDRDATYWHSDSGNQDGHDDADSHTFLDVITNTSKCKIRLTVIDNKILSFTIIL